MKSKILFKEKQKFTQWWLWLMLLSPLGFVLYGILKPILGMVPHSSGNISVSLVMPMDYWMVLLISLSVALFMFLIKMETTIDSERIKVRHLLFVKREFLWSDIETLEIIKYGFVGYGIRISLSYGTVYNVKGNEGLFITLKNGKKRLIGTQKPKELERVVKEIQSNM